MKICASDITKFNLTVHSLREAAYAMYSVRMVNVKKSRKTPFQLI